MRKKGVYKTEKEVQRNANKEKILQFGLFFLVLVTIPQKKNHPRNSS